MIRKWWRCERGTVVADMTKAAIAIALLSVVSAHWLSTNLTPSSGDKEDLARMAETATRNQIDPLYTGSISRAARVIHLDPCTGKENR